MQEYVPGYRLLQEPQIDEPSPATQGQTKVSIFVEVEGAGDYLPPYSGNLDIMTAAATQVGEIDRQEPLDDRDQRHSTHTWSGTHGTEPWGELDLRLTDTCLRDGSHHKRHQFTAQEVHDIVEALDASGIPVIEVDPRRRAGRVVVQLRLLQDPRAGAHQDRGRDRQAGQDRLPDAPGRRHQGRHPGRPGQRRPDLPDRHALHRGGRLDPALRAGPRARPGDGRLPDDVRTPSRPRCWPSRPGSWSTPAASASTSSTRPAR